MTDIDPDLHPLAYDLNDYVGARLDDLDWYGELEGYELGDLSYTLLAPSITSEHTYAMDVLAEECSIRIDVLPADLPADTLLLVADHDGSVLETLEIILPPFEHCRYVGASTVYPNLRYAGIGIEEALSRITTSYVGTEGDTSTLSPEALRLLPSLLAALPALQEATQEAYLHECIPLPEEFALGLVTDRYDPRLYTISTAFDWEYFCYGLASWAPPTPEEDVLHLALAPCDPPHYDDLVAFVSDARSFPRPTTTLYLPPAHLTPAQAETYSTLRTEGASPEVALTTAELA